MLKIIPMFLLLLTLIACQEPASNGNDDPNDQEPISEEGRLFERGVFGESQFYEYAPAFFEDENGIRHIYYCTNRLEGNITDYIGYRTGEQQPDGSWVYSEPEFVLDSTPDTWDSRHVCDPAVVKGQFGYHGETYQYLMAYLGCVTSNNQENMVGLAVAMEPGGPWIKVEEINPIAEYERNTDPDVMHRFQWGYGQPALLSIDRASRVILAYTFGNGLRTGTIIERWDFSDLLNPVLEEERIMTERGLVNLLGGQDFANNADFIYDPETDRVYMVTEDHPHDSEYPDFITTSLKVVFMHGNGGEPGNVLFNPEGRSWNEIAKINHSVTGFDRNHNSGFLRDPYGWILESGTLPVAYTSSNLSFSLWHNLSQYRLHMHIIEVDE